MNKVTLIGRLGADPETKTFGSGSSVTELRIATDDGYKPKDGERVERTNWHRVKAWGGLGGVLAKYLHKGDQVAITGRIEYGEYEVDGHKRYSTEIVADGFDFIGGKSKVGDAPQDGVYVPSPSPEDDIPF